MQQGQGYVRYMQASTRLLKVGPYASCVSKSLGSHMGHNQQQYDVLEPALARKPKHAQATTALQTARLLLCCRHATLLHANSLRFDSPTDHPQVPTQLCEVCLGQGDNQLLSEALVASLYILTQQIKARVKAAAGCLTRGGASAVEDRALEIGQLLIEGGLLTHLPRILTATAQRLQTFQRPAAKTSQAHLKTSFAQHILLCDTSKQPHQHVAMLWTALFGLQLLWTRDEWEHSIAPHLAAATLELFVATMQYLSRGLDQLPLEAQTPPELLRCTAQHACHMTTAALEWCTMGCACCGAHSQQPGRRQLLQSPACLQGSSVLLCVAAYSLLPPQHGGAAPPALDAEAKNSWRQAFSHTQHARERATAWQVACSSCPGLPAWHAELHHVLGCSRKVLVWASTLLLVPYRASALCSVAQAQHAALLNAPAKRPPLQAPQQQHAAQQQHPLLAALAPAVLLHWAANFLTADGCDADTLGILEAACWGGSPCLQALHCRGPLKQH